MPTGVEPPRNQCQCDEGYGGADCSQASQVLEWGQAVVAAPAAFDLLFFSLPEPTGKP